MHRLCEYHRQRVNQTQWWVDERKRIRQNKPGQASMRPKVEQPMAAGPAGAGDVGGPLAGAELELSPEELQFLWQVLFEDEGDDMMILDEPFELSSL